MLRCLFLTTAFLAAPAALAQEIQAGGRLVAVSEGGAGGQRLSVDGQAIHDDEVIFLDPEPLTVGGVTVLTGVAGPGGNACNPAPFVLALPEGEAPRFFGPAETCAYLERQVQPDAIVFAGSATPATSGEVWVWNATTGLTEASPQPFGPDPGRGWEALPELEGQHPVEALRLEPVFAELVSGLGEQWPVFAERIGELGSGGLVEGGYYGEACLKLTCEADYAGLYLDGMSRQVFAFWRSSGEIEGHVYPQDLTLWPAPAIAALRAKDEGQ